MFRNKFTSLLHTCITKEERSQINNLISHLKKLLEKEQTKSQSIKGKEIMKISTETNERQNIKIGGRGSMKTKVISLKKKKSKLKQGKGGEEERQREERDMQITKVKNKSSDTTSKPTEM